MNKDELYECLLKMIEWTKQSQDLFIDKSFISEKIWAKEHCTIKFYLPRGSGHSTFAKKLMESNIFKSPIFLAPNVELCKNAGMPSKDPNSGSVYSVKNGKFKGKDVDAIIIDCVSLIPNEDLEMIFKEFERSAHNKNGFVFVLLE